MCESDEDCTTCIHGLEIGYIWICELHRIQITPVYGAHCGYFEKRLDDDYLDGRLSENRDQ